MPRYSPGIALATALLAACSHAPPTTPSPATSPSEIASGPTFSAPLAAGGEIVLRFVEFRPARGARLRVGEGAFIRVEWTVPSRGQWLGFEAVASSDPEGLELVATSFWSGDLAPGVIVRGQRHGRPVCGQPLEATLSGRQQFGFESSLRNEYPAPGDPDVPFVRVRVWATDYAQACAPPAIVDLDQGDPVLVAIAALGWTKN